MKSLNRAVKTVALAVFGLAMSGCGGAERNEGLLPRSGAHQEGRISSLVQRDIISQRIEATGEKSAMSGASSIVITAVCAEFEAPVGYACEDVVDWPDTYWDWNGTVDVWTREYYGNGSYYASFAGVAETWENSYPIYQNNVYVGADRYVTLENVTSGTFTVTIGGTDGLFPSDSLYIY